MRKIIIVLVVLFCGMDGTGCKEKPKGATGESTEKAGLILFEPSKVVPNLQGGYLDIVEPKTLKITDEIHVGGWAYDPQKKEPAKAVVIVTNGKRLPILPKMKIERKDVAQAHNSKALVNTGWDTTFRANVLGKGKHKLECYALLENGTFVHLMFHDKTYFEIEISD